MNLRRALSYAGLLALVYAGLALLRDVTGFQIDWAKPLQASLVLLGLILPAVFLILSAWRRRRPVPVLGQWVIDHTTVFAGREFWVEKTAAIAETCPWLILTGEPGVGKTALMEEGLAKRLAGRGPLAPVYVRRLDGADWVASPARAVCAAVHQALGPCLDETGRKHLREQFPPDSANPSGLIAEAGRIFGRRVCLLLDQVDDYVSAHADRMARDGQSITAAELLRNPFWRTLHILVEQGTLSCVLATRHAKPVGFRALELLGQSDEVTLPALERGQASTLLDEVARHYIERPPAGWSELRDALLDDLAPDSLAPMVLPIQLKVMLLGLASLDVRTVGDYLDLAETSADRQNAAERAFLENEIVQLTQAPDLTNRGWVLQRVCAAMAGTDGKSHPVPFADLAALLPPDVFHETLRRCLTALEAARVVTETETGWQLYHDYFCRPALALVGRDLDLERRLREVRRGFASRRLSQRFKALPSRGEQWRFARAHVARQLTYGPPALVALAATRFVFNLYVVTAVALGAYGWQAYDQWRTRTADAILGAFDTEYGLSAWESAAVGQFAGAGAWVQGRVIQGFFEPRTAVPLARHGEYLGRACRWLTPRRRTALEARLNARCQADGLMAPARLDACATAYTSLGFPIPEAVARALLASGDGRFADAAANAIPAGSRVAAFRLALGTLPYVHNPSAAGLCALVRLMDRDNAESVMRDVARLTTDDAAADRPGRAWVREAAACRPDALQPGQLNGVIAGYERRFEAAKTASDLRNLFFELSRLPARGYFAALLHARIDRVLASIDALADVRQRAEYRAVLLQIPSALTGAHLDRLVASAVTDIPRAATAQDLGGLTSLFAAARFGSPGLVRQAASALVERVRSARDAAAAAQFAHVTLDVPVVGPVAERRLARILPGRLEPDLPPEGAAAILAVLLRLNPETFSAAERASTVRRSLGVVLGGSDALGLYLFLLEKWLATLDAPDLQALAAWLASQVVTSPARDRERAAGLFAMLPARAAGDHAATVGAALLKDLDPAADYASAAALDRFLSRFGYLLPPAERRRHAAAAVDFASAAIAGRVPDAILEARGRWLPGSLAANAALTSPDEIRFVWDRLFPIWVSAPPSNTAAHLASSLTSIAARLPEDRAAPALAALLRQGQQGARGECDIAAGLIRPTTVADVAASAFRWPTCSTQPGTSLRTRLLEQGAYLDR